MLYGIEPTRSRGNSISSMEGHTHFWYHTSSELVCPTIHGGPSLTTHLHKVLGIEIKNAILTSTTACLHVLLRILDLNKSGLPKILKTKSSGAREVHTWLIQLLRAP